jgi:RING finger protein 113A
MLLTAAVQEWNQQEKAKQQKILEGWEPDAEAAEGGVAADEDEEAPDDELPFACFICRRRWEDCQVS